MIHPQGGRVGVKPGNEQHAARAESPESAPGVFDVVRKMREREREITMLVLRQETSLHTFVSWHKVLIVSEIVDNSCSQRPQSKVFKLAPRRVIADHHRPYPHLTLNRNKTRCSGISA